MEKKTKEEILSNLLCDVGEGYLDCSDPVNMVGNEILSAMQAYADQEKAPLIEALKAVMPYLDMVSAHVNLSDESLEEFIEIKEQAQSALNTEQP